MSTKKTIVKNMLSLFWEDTYLHLISLACLGVVVLGLERFHLWYVTLPYGVTHVAGGWAYELKRGGGYSLLASATFAVCFVGARYFLATYKKAEKM